MQSDSGVSHVRGRRKRRRLSGATLTARKDTLPPRCRCPLHVHRDLNRCSNAAPTQSTEARSGIVVVETISRKRRAYTVQGQSIKAICGYPLLRAAVRLLVVVAAARTAIANERAHAMLGSFGAQICRAGQQNCIALLGRRAPRQVRPSSPDELGCSRCWPLGTIAWHVEPVPLGISRDASASMCTITPMVSKPIVCGARLPAPQTAGVLRSAAWSKNRERMGMS